MTDEQLEQRLRDWYRNEIPADEAAPPELRSRLALIPRVSPLPRRRLASRRGVALLAAAALVGSLAVTAAIGAQFLTQPRVPPVVPAPLPSVAPSQLPSAQPSSAPPAGPLAWTPGSLDEDWPGPVRPEPAGGAIVVPLQEEADEVIPDPLGDTGSAAHPWVDIRELQGGGARIIINLGSLPPFVAPIEQWIAYGVVVDDDRDGIPDRRFGIDNIPGTAPDGYDHRAWITDLHTGRTVVAEAGNYGSVGETQFDNWYPGSGPYADIGALLGFGGQCPGGCSHPGLVDPFYVWASVIENGRVVATDYAPDFGWLLEPSATAKP
jgi:hypothetical protein